MSDFVATGSAPISRPRLRLQTQLLVLLLVFGAFPLAIAVVVGYTVSRAAILEQAERALIELTARQADYLGNEMRRQRLLLRTITGQITANRDGQSLGNLSDLLSGSLPVDGVFDGLRLIDERDSVLASVSLRRSEANWPPGMLPPDSVTVTHALTVHRSAQGAVAYLLTIPVETSDGRLRLEGHVPATDFARLFDVPAHLLGGAEFAILDETNAVLLSPHPHSAPDLSRLAEERGTDGYDVRRAPLEGTPAIVYITDVPETSWVLVTALPLPLVLAPLARLRNATILSVAALIVVVFLAAHLAALVVTRPLRALTLAASEFGRTGVYHRLWSHGIAETETLGASFDHMATMLQRSREEIEQLHQQELERAQQLATVGELASGVAHEIRNPLTGVLGALEMTLRRLPPDEAVVPMLQEAELQLRRIESTTSRLLEYARPPTIQELIVDANLLAERAARVVEGRAQSTQVEVRLHLADPPLSVRADPELLVQVLVNLLLNGIEAMPTGGEVNMSVEWHESEVQLRVRDTGLGIADEHRDKLFRPFFSTKPTGTGLGLAISQRIVRRHGGTLRLEASSNSGTTFVVTLPGILDDGGRA